MDYVRALSAAVILILVVNITLFAMRLIDALTFWMTIAGCWIIAFKIIPQIPRSRRVKG